MSTDLPQIPILVTFGGRERATNRPAAGSYLMLARHPTDAEPYAREMVGRMIAEPFYTHQELISLMPIVKPMILVGTDGVEYAVTIQVRPATDADRALAYDRADDPS